MWGVELRDGVRGRMEAMDFDTNDFQFDLETVHSWKEDSMRVNSDHSRSCTYGEFTLRSDPVTSRFIQRQGIGEGTGMGMSCVMPVSHIPESKRQA
jgi:CRISPR/Cas system endoribonuclease Cas6 (RAMP superfamily)